MDSILRTALVVVIAGLAVVGCGADDGGPGSPPEMSGLTLDPTSITVGAQATITATFTFSDPDRDVAEVDVSVTLPGGQSQDLGTVAVQGGAGIATGAVSVILILNPPTAGEYVFELILVDSQGNRSAAQTASVQAG